MERKFKIGDIVKLKSGSPEMTIIKDRVLGAPNTVGCSWFDGIKEQYSQYPQDALELITVQ